MSHFLTFAGLLALLVGTPAKATDTLLEQALWERVETEDTIAVMELYIGLFPEGQHVQEVLDRWLDRTHRGDWKAVPRPPQEEPDQMI